MGKFVDLTGMKFGRLTVLQRSVRKSKSRNLYWICLCSCGTVREILGDSIKSGKTLSCGCLHKDAGRRRADDLTGQSFGRLRVVGRDESKKRTAWLCRCNCGNEVVVTSLGLKSGTSRSCGCYQRDRAAEAQTKHGLCYTRRYSIWAAMIKRCGNINDSSYINYGGRGIAVCKEWREDFMSFYTWAGDNGYGSQLSIDRIDNDGNYTPENCRWATVKEQNRNTRNCFYIDIEGEVKTLAEWSDTAGVSPGAIKGRFIKGVRGLGLLNPVSKSNIKRTDRERLYIIFYSIKARCYGNPEGRSYKDYGGRGISMCQEWLNDFNAFYKWSIGNGYNKDLSLDRIDNDGDYTPENCRWATMKEQSANRRNTVYLTHAGITMILSDWSKELGVSGGAIKRRIEAGRPENEIFHKGKLSKIRGVIHV